MIADKFSDQATYIDQLNGNEIYYPKNEYPTYFSTGYVAYENVPKQMLPTHYDVNYAPDVNGVVIADEFPNTQDNVFDVFYIGISNGNSLAPMQNSKLRNCALFDEGAYSPSLGYKTELYGKFDSKSVVKPSIVRLTVKFNGILENGTQDRGYSAVYQNYFDVQDMIDLISGKTNFPISYAGFNFDLQDMKYGILWVENEYMTGFFWLSYDINFQGRNVMPNGSLGGYTYLFPSIGCVFGVPRVLFPESIDVQKKWMIYGSIGSAPYGGDRLANWGSGLRSRPSGVIPYGMTYEQTGTYMFFNAGLFDSSYASFYSRGYSGNFTGFNGSSPIITGKNTILNTWTLELIRNYHDKFADNQRNLYIPEGRTDFGCTVQIVTFDDIWKHMCLIPVWATPSHEYEYAQLNDNFWYAEIVNNEYKGNLVRGDQIDENVPDWIVEGDSTKGNYNPEIDRPQPDTPPDDPDSDTSVKPPLVEGDTISLQINRRLSTGNDFVTMYNLTADQLQSFGRVLYKSFADYEPAHIDPETGSIADNFYIKLSEQVTGTLDISAIVNFIISVRQYPFSVATLTDTSISGTSNVYIGSGRVGIPVGSNVRLLTTSISVVDAGSCVVLPATPYNDFRDYYNTTVTCFLPYCGTVELNPIEVMHNILHCYYAIDFYTGECTAFVMVDNGTHQYLCATKSGIIGVLIPITATNSGQLSARHIADNARDSQLTTSAITSLFQGVVGAATGNFGAIGQSVLDIVSAQNQQQILNADRQGRSAVLAPSLSGGSGGAAFMLPDSAYIQIRRGTYSRPNNYGNTCAYPSTVSRKLSTFTGYTQCSNVNMTGISATESEKNMIYNLLQSGVYI